MSYSDPEKKKTANKALDEANRDKRRASYKKYRLSHPEKCRAAQKKWRESHLYEISEYGKLHRTPEYRAKVKAYRQRPEVKARVKSLQNTQEFKARRVGYGLKYKHGITSADRARLLENQGGRCMCGQPDIPGKRLHVDHEHITGKIRGLLCGNCNRGLGLIKESPLTMRALIRYLRRANTWVENDNV